MADWRNYELAKLRTGLTDFAAGQAQRAEEARQSFRLLDEEPDDERTEDHLLDILQQARIDMAAEQVLEQPVQRQRQQADEGRAQIGSANGSYATARAGTIGQKRWLIAVLDALANQQIAYFE